MADTITEDQIVFLEAVIPKLREVILKLALNPRATYSINTGQSSESVTGKDLNRLRALLNGFITDYQMYCEDVNGDGDPTHMKPGW